MESGSHSPPAQRSSPASAPPSGSTGGRMHTPTTEQNGGVGAAAKSVAEHASSLVRLEIQLALLEIKRKVAALGVGVGMLVGAAIFGLFLLAFVLATITALIALALPVWAALLIMSGVVLLAAATLGFVGL